MIRSITHKPPYIFLKTATIPTYYGISIAIPRYIAMQYMSVSYGHSTYMWNRMVVVEKTKREKIVSHQLGISTGYGDAHQ